MAQTEQKHWLAQGHSGHQLLSSDGPHFLTDQEAAVWLKRSGSSPTRCAHSPRQVTWLSASGNTQVPAPTQPRGGWEEPGSPSPT